MKVNKINWDEYLFRSSGAHHIMTGNIGLSEAQQRTMDELMEKSLTKPLTPKQQETLTDIIEKSKKKELPVGVQTYLKKLFREETYNRREQLDNKYVKKGNNNEEDSITLLSLYSGIFYTNNKGRVSNEYITGSCDIKERIDIKSSWSLKTFPFKEDDLDNAYYYQNLCYMDLYGGTDWTTTYVLTNLNDQMVADEIKKQNWNYIGDIPIEKKLEILNLSIYDEETFFRLCKEYDCVPNENSSEEAIDIFTNFVEIPLAKRIVEKVVLRDDSEIKKIYERVVICREFLKGLED